MDDLSSAQNIAQASCAATIANVNRSTSLRQHQHQHQFSGYRWTGRDLHTVYCPVDDCTAERPATPHEQDVFFFGYLAGHEAH